MHQAQRLDALRRYDIVGSPGEATFERLVSLAALAFDTPIAAVSLFGEHRQWLLASLGLERTPAARLWPLCAHGLTRAGTFAISDTSLDLTVRDDAGLQGPPHIRFFASAPLVSPDGHTLGALWVADVVPRVAGGVELQTLGVLAAQVMEALELRRRTRELEAERARLEAAMREATRAQAELTAARDLLAQLATTDELTGVANKRALNQRLGQLVAEGERGRKFAVVLADVDHFKRLNDTYGHGEGDRVLRAVAQVMKQELRKTDLVARVGGEEFCVLLTDVDAPRAVKLAERLREAVAALAGVKVTASFGVTVCARPEDAHPVRLLEAADRALYRAKRGGRDRVTVARVPSHRRKLPFAAA